MQQMMSITFEYQVNERMNYDEKIQRMLFDANVAQQTKLNKKKRKQIFVAAFMCVCVWVSFPFSIFLFAFLAVIIIWEPHKLFDN